MTQGNWIGSPPKPYRKSHCKLATLSRRQEPMLAGRRYRSMSPAGRQSLQFNNEYIKWWPSANNFQFWPGPRAILEIIGFGSPLDKASLSSWQAVSICSFKMESMRDICIFFFWKLFRWRGCWHMIFCQRHFYPTAFRQWEIQNVLDLAEKSV